MRLEIALPHLHRGDIKYQLRESNRFYRACAAGWDVWSSPCATPGRVAVAEAQWFAEQRRSHNMAFFFFNLCATTTTPFPPITPFLCHGEHQTRYLSQQGEWPNVIG